MAPNDCLVSGSLTQLKVKIFFAGGYDIFSNGTRGHQILEQGHNCYFF